MKKFTPGEAINFGWAKMKENFWFFVGLLLVAWIVEIVPTGIANSVKNKITILYIIFTIGAWAIQIIVKMGLIQTILDVVDKGTSSINTLFSSTRMFWKFLVGAILYGLIVLGGLILLVVPGIIWAIKYKFFGYLIVDKNLGPIEALKKSGEITMGSKGDLFVLGFLLMLINLVGVLCLVVGLFATIPLSMVATAYVYRKLMGELAETENIQTPSGVSMSPTERLA